MYKHAAASPEGRCWRFSPEALSCSPSRADGVSSDEERSLRVAGSAHIIDIAHRMFSADPQ